MSFYDKYVELCSAAKKTPSGVAKEIGIHKSSVSCWKTGRNNPSDVTISAIAKYFKVPVSYFSEDNVSSEVNSGEIAIKDAFELASAEEKMDLAARLISSLSEEQQAAFIQRIMFKK